MKRLITITSLFFILISSSVTYGQSLQKVGARKTTSIQTAEYDNSIHPSLALLGYCEEDVVESAVGVKEEATLSAAIYYSAANLSSHRSKKIYGVMVGLTAPVTEFSIFIANSLTEEKIYVQEVGSGNENWNYILLDTPFEIGNQNLYIGYTAKGDGQVGFSGVRNRNSAWLQIEDDEWDNYYEEKFGSLCIQALLSEEESPEREMSVVNVNTTYTKTDEIYTVSGTVRNNTLTSVSSYEISYQIGDNEPITKNIETSLNWWEREDFTMEISVPINVRGTYDGIFTITKVNEGEDEYTNNNTNIGEIMAYDYSFPRRVVVEEGTNIYCVWCPRGMIGMQLMRENYPESFIGIAVHNNYQGTDGMTVRDYSALGTKFFGGSNPSCVANRKSDKVGDPYFNIEEFYLSEMEIPTEIGISVDARFVTGSNSEIEISTATTFGYSSEDVNYRLAYVLVEDSVTGYFQYNAYSIAWTEGVYGPMGGFENLPHPVPADQMVFNEVARAIDSYYGIENSLPTSVTVNEPVMDTYNFKVPATIQNITNLELVVMVLDPTTGEIMNAAKTHVKSDPTSIENNTTNQLLVSHIISQESLELQIEAEGEVSIELYSIDGTRISSQISLIHGREKVSLPISNLKGSYILSVNNRKEKVTKKLFF